MESENDNRIKAAIHYAIGKKCEEKETTNGMAYSKGFVALLAETVFESGELFAKDMEAFTKHGRRTIANAEDVKLICRRNPELQAKLEQSVKETTSDKQSKSKQKKRKSNVITDDDFEEEDC